MIVRRPDVGEREVLEEAELNPGSGLVGDNWSTRGTPRPPDDRLDPDRQLTLMNARVVELLAGKQDRWALAGDQLYVDLDLSVENLPAGTRLKIGSAVIEVTTPPHTGCAKFAERFGMDAARFVNSDLGRRLRLRGLNARVVEPGEVLRGDAVTKI
jgi:MOSC domain-containing protein YiiM